MSDLSEFDVISRFFTPSDYRSDIKLGVGDDAAIVTIPDDQELVISTDTLVETIHFLPDIRAEDLAYRSLAVNLSDLAAMGAEPAWCMLSLTLPHSDDAWLHSFSQQFFTTAKAYQLDLIGGNLSRGPLAVTLQIAGYVPKGQALTRHQAKPGDIIFVTGQFGLAAAGLDVLKQVNKDQKQHLNEAQQRAVAAFLRPQPRITEALAIRDIASSCIDISDGLLVYLRHMTTASKVGAVIDIDNIPVTTLLSPKQAITAGEDYQLCFTVPPSVASTLPISAVAIGHIEAQTGLRLYQAGKKIDMTIEGYRHF
ncbi:MAG: thiamine-phosphate kinase [Pseudomonadota bacterium]